MEVLDCFKTFISDVGSSQLMQINLKNADWKDLEKNGESQHRGVRRDEYTKLVQSIQNMPQK
jgi:hypothetical protein